MADEDVVTKIKRTLLEKYDIPVDHLTYEYVEKCNDGKELERIVKILRSGEEGLYPDLARCAEARLTNIMPGSRVLRVEEPVLRKDMLEPEQWMAVDSELREWTGEMKSRDQQLQNISGESIRMELPGIRRGKNKDRMQLPDNEDNIDEAKKLKGRVPCDYSAWEKFDADKELLKLDIEEERRKEERERKQRQKQKELEAKKMEKLSPKIVDGAGDFTVTEKQVLAAQEKDRGNEYFKAGEYKQALDHYSASLLLNPTPAAYNNRAIANLKLHKYLEALMDCNKVLEREPDNVKALLRRGIAHQNRSSYQKALEDFSRVAILEPEYRLAHSLAQQMRDKCDIRKKSVRMKITDEESSSEHNAKVVELEDYVETPCVADPEMKVNNSWPTMPRDGRVKYNNFGFAKVMCNCSGVPDWVRKPPPKCLVCKEIRERKRVMEEEKHRQQNVEGSCVPVNRVDYSEESDDECTCNHNENVESRTSVDSMGMPVDNMNDDGIVRESSPESMSCSSNVKLDLDAQNKVDTDQEKGSGDTHSKEKTLVSKDDGSSTMKMVKKSETKLKHHQELKATKVQVASKYTKSISRGEEAPVQEVEAIKGLSLDEGTTSKITSPYEFISAWQSVRLGSDPALFASVLQRVDPADLSTLIGNKLDGPMLSTIVRCLEKSFLPNTSLVLDFLQQLAALPRFCIIKLFLDSADKLVIKRLFQHLEQVGCYLPPSLQEDFGLCK